jgi:PEGA domain
MKLEAWMIGGFLTVASALPLTAAAQAQSPVAVPTTSGAPRRPLVESLTGQAASDYHAGRILFDDQDYAGAAIKFERAYQESNEPRLLWNIAACEKNLRHYAKVSALLNRYIAEAGPTMPPDHRAEVDEVIRTVKLLISSVRIHVNLPGALVFVDDLPVGTTPLAGPITVDLGRRSFRITKPGYQDQELTRDIPGGSQLTFDVVLERVVDEGQLRVVASSGATIRIDGGIVGREAWTGMLAAGEHTLRVTGDGMRPYDKEISIVAGQTRTLYVSLEAEPSGGVPTWVWIGAGVVVAGGLATTGYFLFRGPREVAPETASLGEVSL